MPQSYIQLHCNASFLWPSYLTQASFHKCSKLFILCCVDVLGCYLIHADFSLRAWCSGSLLCTQKITTHLEVDLCRCIHLSIHYPLRTLYSNCLVCMYQLTSLLQSWARLLLRAAEQLIYQAPCPQST